MQLHVATHIRYRYSLHYPGAVGVMRGALDQHLMAQD